MLTLLENLSKETLSTQLGYGVVLMVLGMLTVFVFLTVLVYCTKLMSFICRRFQKNKKEDSKEGEKVIIKDDAKTSSDESDREIAIAIALSWDKSKE